MKKLIKYLVVTAFGLALTLFVLISKDIFNKTDPKVIFHILSDAFFIPGVLITCVGLLVFTSNQGSFDMIIYGFQSFINIFRKDINARKHKTFYDYKEAKKDNKRSFGYICLVGLGFLAVTAIFVILWSQQ